MRLAGEKIENEKIRKSFFLDVVNNFFGDVQRVFL